MEGSTRYIPILSKIIPACIAYGELEKSASPFESAVDVVNKMAIGTTNAIAVKILAGIL